MTEASFRLGKVAGVEIGVHYSLLLLAGILIFSTGDGYYSERLPHVDTSVHWGMAVITVLLFFASVIWHELAHALMAKFFQLPVKRITLNMVGGMAEIESDPRNPRQDFWVAVVGPLSTGLLGGACLVGNVLLNSNTPVGLMLAWLGLINVMLAGLNMIPSLPLDGGRVLRSLIWMATGNYLLGTRIAVRLGQFLAIGLMGYGLLEMSFGYNFASGMWSLFMGWFLWMSARGHLRWAARHHHLTGIPLRTVLRPRINLQAEWSLAYALDILSMNGGGSLAPVLRDNQVVGIFSLESVLRVPRLSWDFIQVGQLMNTLHSIPHISLESNLLQTLRAMEERNAAYILVTDEADMVGIASRYDLLKLAEL